MEAFVIEVNFHLCLELSKGLSGSVSASRSVSVSKNAQADGHSSSDADPAIHLDSSGMRVGAAFDNNKAKAGASTLADVLTTMEGAEKPFTVGIRNSNAEASNDANNFCT